MEYGVDSVHPEAEKLHFDWPWVWKNDPEVWIGQSHEKVASWEDGEKYPRDSGLFLLHGDNFFKYVFLWIHAQIGRSDEWEMENTLM